MFAAHLKQPAQIGPEQLAMLQRVFDRACAASGVAKNTHQAEGLAATVLHLFQAGNEEEAQLDEMLSKIEFI